MTNKTHNDSILTQILPEPKFGWMDFIGLLSACFPLAVFSLFAFILFSTP